MASAFTGADVMVPAAAIVQAAVDADQSAAPVEQEDSSQDSRNQLGCAHYPFRLHQRVTPEAGAAGTQAFALLSHCPPASRQALASLSLFIHISPATMAIARAI